MDTELIAGGGSAVVGIVLAVFKYIRSLDRRLRNLEQGMVRIETALGIPARKSMVSVSEAPESD